MSVGKTKNRLGLDTKQGGVLVFVLVLMIVFIVIATYSLRFIVRQAHEISNQEQEEQSFWAADSGVSYVAWLLSPSGGGFEPEDIGALSSITNHMIKDDLGHDIGGFYLTDVVAGTKTIQLKSVGFDLTLTNCQAISVGFRQIRVGDPYVVTSWNHEVDEACNQ